MLDIASIYLAQIGCGSPMIIDYRCDQKLILAVPSCDAYNTGLK
jgi:hypothetical protein